MQKGWSFLHTTFKKKGQLSSLLIISVSSCAVDRLFYLVGARLPVKKGNSQFGELPFHGGFKQFFPRSFHWHGASWERTSTPVNWQLLKCFNRLATERLVVKSMHLKLLFISWKPWNQGYARASHIHELTVISFKTKVDKYCENLCLYKHAK